LNFSDLRKWRLRFRLARRLQLQTRENEVLKISIAEASCELATLHLEGKLSGKWVECLASTCEAELKNATRVSIDLRNVSFVDRKGIALLRNMADCGIEILNPQPFIAEQITNAASS
jgi:lipopolysaccharide biosynthesis regulator YciM